MNLSNKFPELYTLAIRYKNELFNNVIPFWQNKYEKLSPIPATIRNVPDARLERRRRVNTRRDFYNEVDDALRIAPAAKSTNSIYHSNGTDAEKSESIINSTDNYNSIDLVAGIRRKEWLEHAKLGAEFLIKNGMDENGNWYFALTREGNPLVQPYSLASDCFAAMAFSQYALATGDETAKQIALNTYKNIHVRKENPKGKYNKIVNGTRPLISLGTPMILANLSFEMEWLLSEKEMTKFLSINLLI